ncbi:HK97 gp10 family phage protein [Neorhodopirellula pilleata]|uniref:HK97 gp10 family phage protein n=1 Tax=Neorhodopirellula pilleata TaxID=2714738 RepID=A0A5C5ZWP8_9BACT|nr:HK97 gp10 family phage protein [Neorhodopirellula pilleata]TWT91392.1 hypothetical protein Pla100_52420 [Neorhodopirellula pilleata]TWT91441.1 hypothetical protein Pla100_52910 [Neorhodopirellula pilleata]
MIQVQFEIDEAAFAYVDKLEASLRAGVLNDAAESAGEIVAADAKPRVTAPGYRGDKAGLKPLRDSIYVVVREYRTVVIALVGGAWPEGAHGHLVENGHIQKLQNGGTMRVPPHPWLRPAVEATRSQQAAAIESRLKQAAEGIR